MSFTSAGARDYPRVCGGTLTALPNETTATGLSPRVRGNQIWCAFLLLSRRTIPACAGEPSGGDGFLNIPKDYPRVCGGTP